MKRIIILLLTVVNFICCSKQESESERYYVRYYSKSSSDKCTISVETESGTQTFTRIKVFEETFGPVSKRFKCKITTTPNYATSITQKIFVAKNSEQLLLKSEKESEPYVTTFTSEYTIDF